MKNVFWSSLFASALATGCYLGAQNDAAHGGGSPTEPGVGGNGNGGNGGGGAAALDPVSSGFSCDVAAFLVHFCSGCHGSPPSGGAPESLLTYEDLRSPSLTQPGKTVGAVALARVLDGSMPPKPATPPTQAERAAFVSWVQGGMPQEACSAGFDAGSPVKSPYDTPVTCTSGTNWTGGNRESPQMHPGGACISCHSQGEGPAFSIAGTEYPSAHEPNDCNGGSSDPVTVVITAADGRVVQLTPNGVGNFFYEGTLATPYHAKLVAGGRERSMTAAQTSGDCNSCHTESGAENAPGRIMAP